MIRSLPADTVFEAKERTRKKTCLLFTLLTAIYALFFNLAAIAGAVLVFGWPAEAEASFAPLTEEALLQIAGLATAASFFAALIHFWIARSRPLDRILEQLGAKEADPKDDLHLKFADIVHEAEAATGIYPIRAVVIPVQGANAFSAADSKHQSAIGVTEGLLARLDRSELSAVVAHEAAHLAHEDSKLKATACSLFGVFSQASSLIEGLETGTRPRGSFRIRVGGDNALAMLVLWIIFTIGRFLTKLIYMAISRTSEYAADADAVHMCQDPLSLAQALRKISQSSRGGFHIPENFSALFVVNPQYSKLDEEAGLFANLFSTHPPVEARLQKLLAWARADLSSLQKPEAGNEPRQKTEPQSPALFVRHEGAWQGPFSAESAASFKHLNPSSWVAVFPQNTNDSNTAAVCRLTEAVEEPGLRAEFEKKLAGAPSPFNCPRCRVSLVETKYEGAPVFSCQYCGGYLLKGGVLERLIVRRIQIFSAAEVENTKSRRTERHGSVKELCKFPFITCPLCGRSMLKSVYPYDAKVVVDRCGNETCGAVWCDGGELELIQMILENFESIGKEGFAH